MTEPTLGEPETMFATVPDNVLDYFLPASRDQLQRYEHKAPGAACKDGGIEAHDELAPTLQTAAEWEHRGDDDELPLVEEEGGS